MAIDQETTDANPRAQLDAVLVELQVARRRLQLTLDAAGATCGWEWDIPGKQMFADARFAAITHQDPLALAAGVSTDHFFASIHPDDLKRVKIAVAGILAGSEVFSRQYRLQREDGSYRWVRARGQAIFDAEDEPVKFVGMLVDITEQKHMSEQLRIAQSAGGIGTFQHDLGYGTVSVSDQFCKLFGLHPTRTVSVGTLNDLVNPGDDAVIDLSDPNGHQIERKIEFRIRRADDGEERWLARRGEYVDDGEAGARRFMGVVFDITDEKRAQERLREVNDDLSGIANEREQFIAVLGHDLRNPLASMTAGLGMLEKSVTDPHSERVLRLMGESVQRMGSLIENLLDLARGRLGSGIGLSFSRSVRIEPLLARIINEIKAANPDRIFETDFNLTQPIDVDEARIEQMFSNLLGNAVTHGAVDKPVSVSAIVTDGTFELATSNGGDPIPEAAMRRLFRPFHRGEVKPNHQGLGLGLYIASEIAKAHGGSLEAKSDASQTCFTFRMPLKDVR
jgi:PAS domain S-box-containing protein